MKYKTEYEALVQHSHFLRSSMNLAYDRHLQLENTMWALELSQIPEEQESLIQLQVQTAKEIGGVNTRMLLDASLEIEKYHFGPLQVSLCLLYAILEEYTRLNGINSIFSDDDMDTYRGKNWQFLQSLEDLRHSLLHERYDNVEVQEQFMSSHIGNTVQLAIEGEQVLQRYLKLLKERLSEGD